MWSHSAVCLCSATKKTIFPPPPLPGFPHQVTRPPTPETPPRPPPPPSLRTTALNEHLEHWVSVLSGVNVPSQREVTCSHSLAEAHWCCWCSSQTLWCFMFLFCIFKKKTIPYLYFVAFSSWTNAGQQVTRLAHREKEVRQTQTQLQ